LQRLVLWSFKQSIHSKCLWLSQLAHIIYMI